ncbi:MAG TPA: ClpXP protease specificity-enhancing factor [Gammaproteobacteria bacterium]|nr:ClpXP protease specificity-enhancing factor [Gammaproteobacteria bacterium]
MLSNKPYLIRAFYEWIVDSGCTPYLLVNAAWPNCKVPQAFVENNEIVLNISPNAIRDLRITKDNVECRASFSGVVHIISAPVKAVMAIYANENQQGMFFDDEEEGQATEEWPTDTPAETTADTASLEKKKASHLRLVD